MATKLTLTDEQRVELIDYYRFQIRELDQKKREYIDLIGQLSDQPKPAKNQLALSIETASYDPKWSWVKKAAYILTKTDTYLTARDIFDKVLLIEPSLENTSTDNYRNLSSTLSTKVGEKKEFGRFQPLEGGSYLYGLIDWFDKNGEPKKDISPAKMIRTKFPGEISSVEWVDKHKEGQL